MTIILNLKKYLLAAAICSTVFLFASCEKWLEVSPSSEMKYDDIFSYKNGFKDQLTGVYTSISAESLYGAHMTFGMVDVLGQYYFWNQEIGGYFYFNRFEYQNTHSEAIIGQVWGKMYNTIANVNILLEGIEDNPNVLSQEEKNVFKGEAFAIRAFLHLDLLRLFGKSHMDAANENAIPYIKAISKDVTPLSTVEGVIDAAISDLQQAVELLKDDPMFTGKANSSFLGNRTFHINYYAAHALLARAYLMKNDKANAFKSAQSIILANKFSWVKREQVTTSTRDMRDGIFSTEGIFILNNTKLDELTGKYLREGITVDKSNLLVSSPEALRSIFELDKYGGFDWRYIYYFETQKERYLGNSKLWQYKSMPINYKNKQPLIKLSEMYLIAAESAQSKKEAIGYLNILRKHRGFDANHDIQETISDDNLQIEIGKEYRKEFFGEGQWFFYCKRKQLENLPNTVVPFSKSFYNLPIPTQELEYGNR